MDYLEDVAALGLGAVEFEPETTALLWLTGAFCAVVEGLTGNVQPYAWLGVSPGDVPAGLSLGYFLREHWAWSTLMSGGLLLAVGLVLDLALRRGWRRAPYPVFQKGVAWAGNGGSGTTSNLGGNAFTSASGAGEGDVTVRAEARGGAHGDASGIRSRGGDARRWPRWRRGRPRGPSPRGSRERVQPGTGRV